MCTLISTTLNQKIRQKFHNAVSDHTETWIFQNVEYLETPQNSGQER